MNEKTKETLEILNLNKDIKEHQQLIQDYIACGVLDRHKAIEKIRELQTTDIDITVATATAQKGFYLNQLANSLIPIPPLKEQQRIVNEIKKYTPLLNCYIKTETKLNTLNTTFPTQLKKSILQQAVQGKLVPQNPDDEPASVLLERIRAEKQELIKAGKIKKDKNESVIFRRDNSHYEMVNGVERCIDDEIPFEVPKNWCWCRASSILFVSSGDGLTAREMDNGEYPVYGGNGVTGYHSKFNVNKPTLVIRCKV